MIRRQGEGADLGKMPRSVWDEVSERCPGTSGGGILNDTGTRSQDSGGGVWARIEKGKVRSPERWGQQEVPDHPHLSLPPPSQPCSAGAAQDTVLEEQTRTGEPQVWPPAQKLGFGGTRTQKPSGH